MAIGSTARAQISLATAVNLGLQNSSRVKLAQTDLIRAKAALSESRDVFVPAVSANAGVGAETGAPLSPPVVFRIDAQSLVFSFSQQDYIRAARAGVTAAQLALDAVRLDISAEIVNTYLALDNAQRRGAVDTDAYGFANRLVTITGDRYAAGVDPHIELTRAKRTAAQIHLGVLQVEDEIAADQEHLAVLTGLPASGWKTVPESIPPLPEPSPPTDATAENPSQYSGLSAAYATAISRKYTAFGDKRSLLRPQVTFGANYSRLEDAFTTYDQYYPGFAGVPAENGHPAMPNSFNSLSAGIQITLPILDLVRRAKSRESAADAVHAFLEAQMGQASFVEGREKLRHTAAELAARSALVALDHDLAQDELDAVLLRLQAVSGAAGGTGAQASPKDEQNARLAERQRAVDMLNAELQLQQTEVDLLRQEGRLATYLELALPNATPGSSRGISGVPTLAIPSVTHPVAVPTLGTEPVPASPTDPAGPAGALPAGVPTTGTPPSSLPSAPAAAPPPSTSPGNLPSTAPATPHP